ncbi:unnamed protein product, partial [Choristocarpus tenellus]
AKDLLHGLQHRDETQLNDGLSAWQALKSKYEAATEQRMRAVHRCFENCSMETGEDPDQWLLRLYKAKAELEGFGETISDFRLRSAIISGHSPDYNALRSQVRFQSEYSP